MGELESSQQEEFHQIAKAELESNSREQRLKDNVSGNFHESEGHSFPFVESTITAVTAKDKVAKVGCAFETSGVARLAMGTVHSGRKAVACVELHSLAD